MVKDADANGVELNESLGWHQWPHKWLVIGWVPVLELSRNVSDNIATLCCCWLAASFFDRRVDDF